MVNKRKRLLFLAIFIVSLFINLASPFPGFAATVTATPIPSPLTETNFHGAVIGLVLTGDQYVESLNISHFNLKNVVSNMSMSGVQRISNTEAQITLFFTRGDIDGNINNFAIEVLRSGLVVSTTNITSNNMTITAVIEQATATPAAPLVESQLDGAAIDLTLTGDQYVDPLDKSYFVLQNGFGNLAVSGVLRMSSTQARIILSVTQGDIDVNITDFRVAVQSAALARTASNLNSNNMTITAVTESITPSYAPGALTEDRLNNTMITLTLTGDKFIPNISGNKFELRNNLPGFSVARIDRINDVQGNLYLAFNGTDFDADKTNFQIRLYKEGLQRTATDLTTSNMTITAIIESDPNLTATTNPYTLFENGLDGAVVHLTVRQNAFKNPSAASYFRLNNAPPGTYIIRATYVNSYVVNLDLGYPGEDIDEDYPDFTITALSTAFTAPQELTSHAVPVYAVEDIEGQGFYNVTGNSYPQEISMVGYDARNREFFFNVKLSTTLVAVGQTATFYYFTELFDETGSQIGNQGSYTSPASVTGVNHLLVKNRKITISSALTPGYRLVASIVSASP